MRYKLFPCDMGTYSVDMMIEVVADAMRDDPETELQGLSELMFRQLHLHEGGYKIKSDRRDSYYGSHYLTANTTPHDIIMIVENWHREGDVDFPGYGYASMTVDQATKTIILSLDS